MKLVLTPDLSAWREEAKRQVDRHFADAPVNIHLALAHMRKRFDAHRCLAGDTTGIIFAAEAARANLSLRDFAGRILAKPDDLAIQEDRRRMLIERVRAAASVAEFKSILAELGAPEIYPEAD